MTSIEGVGKSRLVVIGYLINVISTLSIVDLQSMRVVTTFLCYFPVLTASHRLAVFFDFKPVVTDLKGWVVSVVDLQLVSGKTPTQGITPIFPLDNYRSGSLWPSTSDPDLIRSPILWVGENHVQLIDQTATAPQLVDIVLSDKLRIQSISMQVLKKLPAPWALPWDGSPGSPPTQRSGT